MISWRFVLILGLAACGCGKSAKPPKTQAVPIKGTVKLDGQPVSGADVVFVSETTPAAFAGKTNDVGVYELQGIAGHDTPLQGTYKVTISRRVKADGTPLSENEPPMSPENIGAVEQMPPQFARADLSRLSATVAAEGGTHDFDLKSK